MVVDPHFHFIDGQTPYLVNDLFQDISEVPGITDMLFVECNFRWSKDGTSSQRAIAETQSATNLAKEVSRRGGPEIGIIGYVDMREPTADDLLQAHIDAAEGRLRGIRNVSAWHPRAELRNMRMNPPPGLMADPAVANGAAALARRGLPLDIWCYSDQLDDVLALAGRVPELTIVLNHVGGPVEIATSDVIGDWRRRMDRLAELPNIHIKLGGIGMPVFGYGFDERSDQVAVEEMTAAWKPVILEVIERFGASRCMFESNFPVDKAAISYGDLWRVFDAVTVGLAESDRRQLFELTAVSVYGLRTERRDVKKED